MQGENNGRTVAIYTKGDGYMVEVDYGKNYQPSQLEFDTYEDALIRYNSIMDEPKMYKWLKDDDYDDTWYCSNCKAVLEAEDVYNHNYYYCYHCGKKMQNPILR